MKIAFILFDGVTLLDFIGVYDPISRLKAGDYVKGLAWDLCGLTEVVTDDYGLEIKITKVAPNLADYDMLIVPGGFGTRKLLTDEVFLNWLKTGKEVAYKASVCTGSLLLGASGMLVDKKATTHFKMYDKLSEYCKEVVEARIVEDGDIISAGAVSSSLDLGLYICEKLTNAEVAALIKTSMDYK